MGNGSVTLKNSSSSSRAELAMVVGEVNDGSNVVVADSVALLDGVTISVV